MIHEFTKKSDFELMLSLKAKGHHIQTAYHARMRTELYYFKDFHGQTHYIGYSATPFSHGRGYVFGDNTTLAELRKSNLSHIAEWIEFRINNLVYFGKIFLGTKVIKQGQYGASYCFA